MDDTQWIPEEHYREAAEAVQKRISQVPTVGLILGSGLGTLVEEIANPQIIPYQDIPHWPHSTVVGHAGRLVVGQLEDRTVLAMQGRIHFYEGYSMAQVTLPVRVMRLLGIQTLIVTNAAGGLNPNFSAGDIMVIEDHIFMPGMAGYTPLRGPNLGAFGPRFSIHTHMYDPDAAQAGAQGRPGKRDHLREGVYVGLSGPTFETPAEVRMLRSLGRRRRRHVYGLRGAGRLSRRNAGAWLFEHHQPLVRQHRRLKKKSATKMCCGWGGRSCRAWRR